MTSYSDRLKEHLARYKRERLGIAEDGIWSRNKRSYSHILPSGLERLNILETARREFWACYAEGPDSVRLHSDFHHLNSSQALACNVFFPLLEMTPDGGKHLLNAMRVRAGSVRRWALEDVPDPAEGTNFDATIELESGAKLYIEVKLSEAGFGACSPDDAHRAKLSQIYTPRLSGKVVPGSLEETEFFPQYQLFRNVSYLRTDSDDRVIVLAPRANGGLWSIGEAFSGKQLTDAVRPAFQMVALEDLIGALRHGAGPGAHFLSVHAGMLAEKYLLPMPAW
jgi:hypothetical protein